MLPSCAPEQVDAAFKLLAGAKRPVLVVGRGVLNEGATKAVVIGAGPAGLTAAFYLARFRRSVLCVSGGTSRTDRR